MKKKTRKYDVAFFEVFKEEKVFLEKHLPKTIRAFFSPLTIQEGKFDHPPADIISVRTQSKIPASWATTLRAILTRSQGYDHLLKFLSESKRKVACGYLGDYCSRSVAEHAIMLTFMLLRNIKRQSGNFQTFRRDNITGLEIKNRKALIVGVGKIGSEIISLARALGMVVRGVDVVKQIDDLEYVSLSAGIPWADVIYCALPLTHKTQGLLKYDVLKNMKKKALLINISRGEITPTIDLQKLIQQNILGGLALDVFEDESEFAQGLRNNAKLTKTQRALVELSSKENVVFTPHNAFNTQEASERKAFLSAQSVDHFLKKGSFPVTVLFEE